MFCQPLLCPASFSFGHPTSAQFVGWNAGQVGLDVENWRAVQHVDAVDMQQATLATEEFDDRQAYWIGPSRRSRGEDAVRAIINWRDANQFESFRAIEYPNDEQMRETLNVGEPGFEFRENFKRAFYIVLCTKALRNLLGVRVRSLGDPDRLWREHIG